MDNEAIKMPELNTHLWETESHVFKFNDPNDVIAHKIQTGKLKVKEAAKEYRRSFIEEVTHYGNIATSVGLKALIYWAVNGAGGGANLPTAPSPANLFNNANANHMVGAGSGAAAQTDTYSTFTTPAYKVMDSGYPNMSAASPWIVTWQSTYGSADANIAWNEFAVANAATTPVILNRYVVNKGTKASGESWTLQTQITFS